MAAGRYQRAEPRAHRPNSNPVARDDAERPVKIRVRLDQRQSYIRGFLGGLWNDAEEDDAAASRKPATENSSPKS